MSELFQMAEIVREAPLSPCERPYFLAAQWGNRWAIHRELFREPDSPDIDNAIETLRSRGWTHITVLKLPL